MYSTNTYLSHWLPFIVLAIDSVNYRYGYVSLIGSCIYWGFSSVSFNISLIILSYLRFFLIIFCIWLRQNSLNMITYTFFGFSSSFFSLFVPFSIFIFNIYLKESFSDSIQIGSSSSSILLIGISLLKSKITPFWIDSSISIPFMN